MKTQILHKQLEGLYDADKININALRTGTELVNYLAENVADGTVEFNSEYEEDDIFQVKMDLQLGDLDYSFLLDNYGNLEVWNKLEYLGDSLEAFTYSLWEEGIIPEITG